MGNRASKGSEFERHVCRQLSHWWTNNERDDIFWRTSQSGGRATFRAQKGKKTFGGYGDITAIDPIGLPLTRLWTIELKCGKSHGTPDELLEKRKRKGKPSPFEKTLEQAYQSSLDAKSVGWWIISKRDYHPALVFVDWETAKLLKDVWKLCFHTKYHYGWRFVGCQFEDLLEYLDPANVVWMGEKRE